MQKYRSEVSKLFKLMVPILIAQLAFTVMGFVDTVMAGAVSATDMAAVAIANSIWFPVLMFLIGILMAITPIVAQLYGAKKKNQIAQVVQQGIWFVLITFLPMMALLYYSPMILEFMHVEDRLAELTTGYLRVISLALPFACGYQVFRSYHEGLGITKPTMVIGLIGIMVNVPANYIFINGHFGMPALGGVGCAVASALVFVAMCFSMIAYSYFHKDFKEIKLFDQVYGIDKKEMSHIISVGFPIAASMFCEVTLFAVVSILLAPLGAITVAAHQVALNFSSMVFMLPLSIGIAATITVGQYVGEKKPLQAKFASITAMWMGVGFSVITAIFTIILRNEIAEIYTEDMTTINIATGLMLIAAVYQISDAVQVIAAGALRGYKETSVIFYITLFSYWAVGMTIGYTLALTNLIVPAMGAAGFWIGFISGLTMAAILLSIKLASVYKKTTQDHTVELATAA
ncbi:MATE family efflux transporter [Moritella sp. 5]|uniref:MATE family efflux transporter n=1 Tax=Moritella sp. 5 TaxID=2746231 RepID=UPI001BA909DD|nr:MATE family efflux transporter [Moritella sp. 5]QUM80644.1 MATE family efflux transporter [Moritella sp. 5]